MKQIYVSSCDCGRVKIETAFDLARGTGKCNCTICMKMRWWTARVEPWGWESAMIVIQKET